MNDLKSVSNLLLLLAGIYLVFFKPLTGFTQVKGLEGRWLITNVKESAFEKSNLRIRRFREGDKFRKLSFCLNFRNSTGYVLEEKFWRITLPESYGPENKTYGYNGKVLNWIWESKDKFRVFDGDTFREFRMQWRGDDHILLKEIHSRSPRFDKPFRHNLSSQ